MLWPSFDTLTMQSVTVPPPTGSVANRPQPRIIEKILRKSL